MVDRWLKTAFKRKLKTASKFDHRSQALTRGGSKSDPIKIVCSHFSVTRRLLEASGLNSLERTNTVEDYFHILILIFTVAPRGSHREYC